MARLILEEGGQRRAFRVNDGKLSIGSGEKCTLKLTSPDVAEMHAELEVKGSELILRPMPGVTPPTVLGKAIGQPTRLPKSAEFRVGSAVFRLEPEEHGGSAGPVVKPGARATGRPAAGGRGAQSTAGGQRVVASRRNVSRGMPTWTIFVIIGVLGVVVYFVAQKWMADGAMQYDPDERFREAVANFDIGAYERCKVELDRIDAALASPALLAKVKDLRDQIADLEEEGRIAALNVSGTKWMETQLKKYVERYLQGDKVDRSRARLFIKRCDEFRRRWPKHHDMDWVDRYRTRFYPIAEMDDHSTLADVQWEVKRLTAGKPRDYVTVFGLLDEFLSRASGSDRDAALAIMDTQLAGRVLFAEDQMLQSRYHWDKAEYGKAVGVLVQLITLIGEEEMQRDAVDAFVKMRTQDGEEIAGQYLLGYKNNRPADFEKMIKIPEIRALAEAGDMLD